ncbi:MAG: GNAT family N-acetyltransferase [Pseudomonadota bacterium]
MSADLPDLTVRRASVDDEPALRPLVEAAFAQYTARIGKPTAPVFTNFTAAIVARHVLVAEVDGTILGYVLSFAQGGDWYLDTVAVAPHAQGQGVGRRLIAEAEALGRRSGAKTAALFTNAAMHKNLSLYPRLGYTEERRGHEDGYDRVYFRKQL